MHSVVRGTGTPKDRDEVNRRDTCEWDGWVCVRDVIGAPSIFKLTRRAAALARVLLTLALSCERKTTGLKWKSPPLVCCAVWTPEVAKNRSVSRWVCKNSNLMNSLCNLPEVLARSAWMIQIQGGCYYSQCGISDDFRILSVADSFSDLSLSVG
jgi:hypothetical protein